MKRKIVKQGNNTLTVTLPRAWTQEHGITAGMDLSVAQDGNSIVLSPGNQRDLPQKSADIGNSGTLLPLILLNLYRKGYDSVVLSYEKSSTLIAVQQLVRDTGYHIIDHTTTSCTLTALTEGDRVELNEVLRKLFLLVKMRFEAIERHIATGEREPLLSSMALHTMPTKISTFCHRLLSQTRPHNAHSLFLIVHSLENLDTQLAEITNSMLTHQPQSDDLVHLLSETSSLYNQVYACYYRFTIEECSIIMNRRTTIATRLAASATTVQAPDEMTYLALNNSLLFLEQMMRETLAMRV